jgi:hypothetical protein
MDEFNLSPEEIERIVNFQGYGRSDAPVCFIGIEEGLGKMTEDDAKWNLKARGNFEAVMDLRDAHLRLREGGQPIDIETRQRFTQVWQYMAKVMLTRKSASDGEKNKNCMKLPFVEYIRFRLGRGDDKKGETFMTELSPIPTNKSTNKEWYRWFESRLGSGKLRAMLKNREQKLNEILTKPTQILKGTIPKLVVCYSLPRANEFAQLLGIEWKPVPDCPRVCVASRDSVRYLLLPFFGQSQMENQVIQDLFDSGLLG